MGNLNSSSTLSFRPKEFYTALDSWFKKHKRALPWRKNPSLYKTVVSEFMLQQTQVSTVLPFFARWLERFPNFETLAQADEEEAIKHWEGLGYYTRARNLHKLAKAITELKTIPKGPKDWIEFPGIGPYSSAAITSIAFKEKIAVVDGNVIRILTRLTENNELFKGSADAIKKLGPLANELINPENPGDYNEAIMELGATVCTKQNPLCTTCPVLKFCKAGQKGTFKDLPNLLRKKQIKRTIERLFIQDKAKVLLHKRPSTAKRLANIFEIPEKAHLKSVQKLAENNLVLRKKRGISNESIEELFYKIPSSAGIKAEVEQAVDLHWVDAKNLEDVTLSGPHKRWILELL